jgi:hypothetical protein
MAIENTYVQFLFTVGKDVDMQAYFISGTKIAAVLTARPRNNTTTYV